MKLEEALFILTSVSGGRSFHPEYKKSGEWIKNKMIEKYGPPDPIDIIRGSPREQLDIFESKLKLLFNEDEIIHAIILVATSVLEVEKNETLKKELEGLTLDELRRRYKKKS